MWTALKLKADESAYFLEQLRAHTKYPRLFLFYLSAFLTSTRSITFHLQKQFTHTDPSGVYKSLVEEMLSDNICKYFIDLRNHIEKQGYPPLSIRIFTAYKDNTTEKLVWYLHTSYHLFSPHEPRDRTGLEFIEELIKHEWDAASLSGTPAQIKYEWKFLDYPTGEKDVIRACENHANRLWHFIAKFRTQWEQENDPDAFQKKWDRHLDSLKLF